MNANATHCSIATLQGSSAALRSCEQTLPRGVQAFKRSALALTLMLTLGLAACGGGGSDGATASPTSTGPSTLAANTNTNTGSTATAVSTTTIAAATSVVASASSAAATTATTTRLSTDPTCGNTQLQAQLIAGINALRAAAQSCGSAGAFNAAPALAWNAALFDAAAAHSTDMASRGYFSHVSPEGQTMQNRVDAAGYKWTALAENIASGQTSVSDVLTSWMASPGHCANIMGEAYREVALSCVRSESGTRYWTMNFGRS